MFRLFYIFFTIRQTKFMPNAGQQGNICKTEDCLTYLAQGQSLFLAWLTFLWSANSSNIPELLQVLVVRFCEYEVNVYRFHNSEI